MYDIKVRNVRREELDEVIRVEQEAWPAELRASKDKFESRINVFPEGFFGVYVNDKLVGVSTSTSINYNFNDKFDWYKLTDNGYGRNHNIKGNCLYVVSVGTSQTNDLKPVREYLKKNNYDTLGAMLVKKQIGLAKKYGKEVLVLTARVPGYRKYYNENKGTIDEYLDLTINKNGIIEAHDPEIRFYKRCGLNVSKIIPNAEEDHDSMNYGVIMSWKNKL